MCIGVSTLHPSMWQATVSTKEWGVGCIFCARSAQSKEVASTRWSRFEVSSSIQIQNLLQHASGQQHQIAARPYSLPDAVSLVPTQVPKGQADSGIYMQPVSASTSARISMVQCLPSPTIPAAKTTAMKSDVSRQAAESELPPAAAESPAAWLQAFRVAKHAQVQGSSDKEHDLSRHKLRQMFWCLAEAKREESREWFGKAGRNVVISLAHDARKSVIAVRYVACNKQLERRSGLVGLVTGCGDATAYSQQILECMQQMFSYGAGALDPKGVLDESALNDFHRGIQCMTADGAPYAQKASRLLTRELRNLRVVIRDRSHAVTGALKNAAEADTLISSFKEQFISGPRSVCKLITHNQAFGKTFALACEAEQSTTKLPVLTALHYGKARFLSQVLPERRLFLQLLGLVLALQKFSKEGKTVQERTWAATALEALHFENLAVMGAVTDAEANRTTKTSVRFYEEVRL